MYLPYSSFSIQPIIFYNLQMADRIILPSTSEEQTAASSVGYEYTIGPKQSLPNEANAPYIPSKIYSESLLYKKQQVALSSMAFLFQEMVSQIYKTSKSTSEFENRLSGYGYSIGIRLLEVLNLRASVPSGSYSRNSTFSSSNSLTTNVSTSTADSNTGGSGTIGGSTVTTNAEKNYESTISLTSMVIQMRRRDLKILDVLQFVHGSVWTYLFGYPSNDLVKSSERENEYMIVDNSPILTEFISGNVSCDYFLCGIIDGFLTKSGFPCTVSPHPMAENNFDNRVVYLIKFDKQVLERENLRYNS